MENDQDFSVESSECKSGQTDQKISLAWAKLSAGDRKDAVKKFTEAVTDSIEEHGSYSLKRAYALHEIGIGLFFCGPLHATECAAYFTLALKIFTIISATDTTECASLYRSIGALYASRAMNAEAIKCLRKALDILQVLPEPAASNRPRVRRAQTRQHQLMARMEEFAIARASVNLAGPGLPPISQLSVPLVSQ